MITDLIRHDLHGVAGAGNINVSKLMNIETYTNVYQLVSVIQGELGKSHDERGDDNEQSGEIILPHVPRRWSMGSNAHRPSRLVEQPIRNVWPNITKIHRSISSPNLSLTKPKRARVNAYPTQITINRPLLQWSLPRLEDMHRHALARVREAEAAEAAEKKQQNKRKQNGHVVDEKPSIIDKPFAPPTRIRYCSDPQLENCNGTSPVTEGFRSSLRNVPGIDVLAASLPPGSMTGAPKKRSCELLQNIECHKPRGVYSGVLGYLDVGGGGDFSVVIRTAYRWDSDVKHVPSDRSATENHLGLGRNVDPRLHKRENGNYAQPHEQVGIPADPVFEEWTIGAGGAITAQSTINGEYDEMLTKLNSTLGAFASNLTKKAPWTWTDKNYQEYITLLELISNLNIQFPGRVPKNQAITMASALDLMAELHNRFPESISRSLAEAAAAAAYEENI